MRHICYECKIRATNQFAHAARSTEDKFCVYLVCNGASQFSQELNDHLYSDRYAKNGLVDRLEPRHDI